MSDRPIIFSAPMIRALRDGRKTQTRRILKVQPPDMPEPNCAPMNTPRHAAPYLDAYCGDPRTPENPRGMSRVWHWWQVDDRPGPPATVTLYAPGDRLWVREAWRSASCYDDLAPSAMGGEEPVRYEADASWQTWGWGAPLRSHGRLRPSIHMPRWASRLTLTVTDVRVQRLQEITEEDARAEGCEAYKFPGPWWQGYKDLGGGDLLHQQAIGDIPPDWMIEPKRMKDSTHLNRSAVDAFAGLSRQLHGPDAWAENRWVEALTFTVRHGNIDAAAVG